MTTTVCITTLNAVEQPCNLEGILHGKLEESVAKTYRMFLHQPDMYGASLQGSLSTFRLLSDLL